MLERAAAAVAPGIGAVLVVEADDGLVKAGLLFEVAANIGLDDCAVCFIGKFADLLAGVEGCAVEPAVLFAVEADAGELAGEDGVGEEAALEGEDVVGRGAVLDAEEVGFEFADAEVDTSLGAQVRWR